MRERPEVRRMAYQVWRASPQAGFYSSRSTLRRLAHMLDGCVTVKVFGSTFVVGRIPSDREAITAPKSYTEILHDLTG